MIISDRSHILESVAKAPKGRSLTSDAIARFRRNKAAMASTFVLGFIVLAALIGPSLLPMGL